MHFLSPLILIAIVPFLAFWWIFFREKIGYSYPNTLMRQHSHIYSLVKILWGLRFCMIVFIFFLLAEPSLVSREKVPISPGKDIVLLLDLSKSMLAGDIAPNRLEWAKQVLLSFLDRASIDRFGLIVFAGKAFTLSPLTEDRSGVSNIIHSITPDTIRQYLPWISGTNIGDALLAGKLLTSSWSSVLILITDGRANIGIDPLVAARSLRDNGTRVYTIGIGALSGSILSYLDANGIRQYFYDEKWEKIRADIDRPMLEKIAEITWGKFFLASDVHIFEDIFERLSREIITPIEYRSEEKYTSLAPLFLFLLWSFWLIHTLLLFLLRKN